jgi:hypothetical protein
MRFKVNGVDVQDLPELDERVVKIDAWYDRHTRSYCIQKLNKEGYQVGDAIYVGNKTDKNSVVKELTEEYGL